MFKRLILILFMFQSTLVFAQQRENPYHIKKPESLFGDRCADYKAILKKLPADVRYNIMIEDRVIYFSLPSLEHFQQIFDKNKDGIAIDIIHKDQYQCEGGAESGVSWPNKGYMLAPMYKEEMEKNMFFDELNNVVVKYGLLPERFNLMEIECNVLTIQNKALCSYLAISNMDYGNWDLLETGLYWDSIPDPKGASGTRILSKEIIFTIPFEKNKARFLASDIKPLYDSLDLNDYDIEAISILAYTSVEGSIELNKKLQQERAQSIIDALQAYQKQEIRTEIMTKENWGQFAQDITGTEFQYLKKYPKEEIRSRLFEDKALLNALEPILKNQRKGLVKLNLQKKLSVDEDDPEKLKTIFHQSISANDLEQAIFLQHVIFDGIRNEKLAEDFVRQLEIPKESAFGPLFNNIVLFNRERINYDLLQTIKAFQELQSFIPNSPKIKYNLAALKIEAWAEGPTEDIDRKTIENLLRELDKTNIDPSLVERLKINYYLLLTQYLTYEKRFKEKRRSLQNIYHYYRKLSLDDAEALSLARFLAFYSEFKLATDILYPRVNGENVSEDLLFYYLKLTIGSPRNTRTAAYSNNIRTAVRLNRKRYCNLFLPKAQGGFTFQLKANEILMDSYCENCTISPAY